MATLWGIILRIIRITLIIIVYLRLTTFFEVIIFSMLLETYLLLEHFITLKNHENNSNHYQFLKIRQLLNDTSDDPVSVEERWSISNKSVETDINLDLIFNAIATQIIIVIFVTLSFLK
ncbi:hypothetical protein ACFL57_05420 [Candidatus Margulisiibacteriota bacterium]